MNLLLLSASAEEDGDMTQTQEDFEAPRLTSWVLFCFCRGRIGEVRVENKTSEDLKLMQKLFAALQHLGYDFESFECSKTKRVIYQKLVYALQRAGMNFGYSYNLYINGPYSPGLADDGYFIARHLSDFSEEENRFRFSEKGLEKVERARDFLANETNNRNWLESICTLDYLYTFSPMVVRDRDRLFQKFRQLKPDLFDEITLDRALRKIQSHA